MVADKLNGARKLVVSETLAKADWENSTLITGEAAKEIGRLKKQDGRSPTSFSSPTCTTSNIFEAAIPEAFTAGPEIPSRCDRVVPNPVNKIPALQYIRRRAR
jgi:hypothetical protein